MSKSLSEMEKQVLMELERSAGGVGRMRQIVALNQQQNEMLQTLQDKGYVMMTKRNYMVLSTSGDPD